MWIHCQGPHLHFAAAIPRSTPSSAATDPREHHGGVLVLQSSSMRYSVVLGQWLDRPLDADLETAILADRLGYDQLWVPEMAKAYGL